MESAKNAILLDDTEDDNMQNITVNQQYAEKYNARKQKEALKNVAGKLGFASTEVSTDDESSEEDSDGELLTKEVQAKVLTTISRIRQKDPCIYDPSTKFFTDDDFAHQPKPSNSKPLTFTKFLSRTLAKEGASAIVDAEEESNAKEFQAKQAKSFEQEQQELKQAFLEATNVEGEDDNDDLFHVANKTAEEQANEALSFQDFLKKRSVTSKDDSELLHRYFHNDEELDDGEKFLRDYVLFEGWKEGNRMPQGSTSSGTLLLDDKVDEADADFLKDSAHFEALYNFRFEETPCPTIEGHARRIYDSVRQKEDKRRRKRLERKEKKEQEKAAKKLELERLKQLKREEIIQRLKVIQNIAGLKSDIDPDCIDFDTEFNEEAHEREMQAILGDNFEQQDEVHPEQLENMPAELEELPDMTGVSGKQRKKLERLAKKRLKLQQRQVDDDEAYAPLPLEEDLAEVEETEDTSHAVAPEENENPEYAAASVPHVDEEGNHLWYLCDGCNYGIPARKKRYECTRCDDFVLCGKCFRSIRHPHRLVARRVPDDCKPPPTFMLHRPLDNTDPDADISAEQKAEMDAVLEEYYKLDYEDIIAGMPVRFKYTQIPQDDFGLTTETILNKSDNELNRIVSLKQYAPYRKRNSAKQYQMRSKKNKYTSSSSASSNYRLPPAQPPRKREEQPKRKKRNLDVLVKPPPENISHDRLAAYGLTVSTSLPKQKRLR